MKLTRLFIKSYQHLSQKDYQFEPGFNLLFGPNERGKSLTIDVIVKQLLGKDSKKFAAINRVTENPGEHIGFVELEYQTAEGQTKKKKFSGEQDLPELLEISADDCQNIFFIRNSQLSIGQELDQERQFYTSFTDRLTGLKTQQIAALKQEIRQQAELMDKKDEISSTTDNQQLGERLTDAQQLLSEQGKLSAVLGSPELQEQAKDLQKLAALKQQLQDNKQQLTKLDQARKRQDYEQIKSCLDTIQACQDKLAAFAQFNQDDWQQWRELKARIQDKQKAKKDKLAQLEQKQTDQNKFSQRQTELKKELAKLNRKKQQLESRILPKIEELKKKKARIKAQPRQKPLWHKLAAGSLLVLVAALAASIFTQALLVYLIAGAAFIAVSYSSWQLISAQTSHTKFEQEINQLKLALTEQGIEAADFEHMLAAVQTVLDQHQQLETELRDVENKLDQLAQRVKELKTQELAGIKQDISQFKNKIEEISIKTKVESVGQYRQQLEKKQELQSNLEKAQEALRIQLGTKTKQLQQLASHAKQKLEQLAQFAGQAQELEYSENRHQQLKARQQRLEAEIEQLEQQSQSFADQLQELERAGQRILNDPEEPVSLQSMADVKRLQARLNKFADAHLKQKRFALETIAILSEIEQQDKQKISTLFGPDSIISHYFSQITDGRYRQVEFDQQQEIITVTDNQGTNYTPDKLSAGTHDQLYLSIRMGLADKLLAQPGFFVMDDPLIKADQQRLEQQLKMLLELADNGWQILYFSAKDEVKQALDQAGSYRLLEVE